MQIPIRKSGKYTHAKSDPHLTVIKLGELKRELENLKLRRPRAATEVKRLAAMGDFSENAAYALAKGRLRNLNQRIVELTEQLKSAQVITPAKNAATVQLGHRVTIAIAGKQKTYRLLGSAEANPSQGVISHRSPIGSALIGHKTGDSVTYQSAAGNIECKIIKIE
ncbi:MAG: GreA/GreB family elongation factor [Candidatus Kerfeldbacteria bacterium]|nr:GreA/GreB family elongation factor [Candidatus Kerfeldbacteria bacterium]